MPHWFRKLMFPRFSFAGENGGAGGGGASNTNQPQNPPDVAKLVADGIAAAMPALQQSFDQKLAAAIAGLKPAEKPVEKPADNGAKKPTIEEMQAQLNAVVADNKAKDAKLAGERRLNAVRTAASKIEWFDTDDAVEKISRDVAEKDGRYFVLGTEKVGGVDVQKEFSLEDAAQRLAKAKPHLVKAKVAGGTGASGGSAGTVGTTTAGAMTYEQIRAWAQQDPASFRVYFNEHREEYEAKKRTAVAAK